MMNIPPNYRQPEDPVGLYGRVNISSGEHRRRYLATRITFEFPESTEPYTGDRRGYWYLRGYDGLQAIGGPWDSFWVDWGHAPPEQMNDKLQAWLDFCAGWEAGPPPKEKKPIHYPDYKPTKHELRFARRYGRLPRYGRRIDEREYCHLGDLPVGQRFSLGGNTGTVVAQDGATTTLEWDSGVIRQLPEARLACKDELIDPPSDIAFF